MLGDELAIVEGMCGVVEDGIVPGLFGYEAGQSAVGDIFAWFAENSVPPDYHDAAETRGVGVHDVLAEEAAALQPGRERPARARLVERQPLGARRRRPERAARRHDARDQRPEIYRALIEATAFGTRIIIEAFESARRGRNEIVACGGLPEQNPLLMQIFADVTGREFAVAASKQAPALGSAMFGAVAAGAARRRLRLDRRGCIRWRISGGASRIVPIAATPRGLRRSLPRVPAPTRPVRARRRRRHANLKRIQRAAAEAVRPA